MILKLLNVLGSEEEISRSKRNIHESSSEAEEFITRTRIAVHEESDQESTEEVLEKKKVAVEGNFNDEEEKKQEHSDHE